MQNRKRARGTGVSRRERFHLWGEERGVKFVGWNFRWVNSFNILPNILIIRKKKTTRYFVVHTPILEFRLLFPLPHWISGSQSINIYSEKKFRFEIFNKSLPNFSSQKQEEGNKTILESSTRLRRRIQILQNEISSKRKRVSFVQISKSWRKENEGARNPRVEDRNLDARRQLGGRSHGAALRVTAPRCTHCTERNGAPVHIGAACAYYSYEWSELCPLPNPLLLHLLSLVAFTVSLWPSRRFVQPFSFHEPRERISWPRAKQRLHACITWRFHTRERTKAAPDDLCLRCKVMVADEAEEDYVRRVSMHSWEIFRSTLVVEWR